MLAIVRRVDGLPLRCPVRPIGHGKLLLLKSGRDTMGLSRLMGSYPFCGRSTYLPSSYGCLKLHHSMIMLVRRIGSTSKHHFRPQRLSNQFMGMKNRTVAPKKESQETYMRDKIANIYRIMKYSTWDSAQRQLRGLSLKWDSYTVNQVLKSHPPMEKAWLFFNWASELNGFKHDQYTYTTMLNIFGEAGRIPSMLHLYKLMQDKGLKVDVVTYTSMMHWFSCSGDVDEAVKIWEEMKEKGCHPTVVSYTAYIKIMLNSGRVKKATDAYKEMLRLGLSPTCHTYTVLTEYMVASGKCEGALDMFSRMQEAGVPPDKAMCNILVEQCCKVKEPTTIMKILCFMKENRLVLRRSVFLEAQRTLNNAGESDDLLRQIHPHFLAASASKEELVELSAPSSNVPCIEDRDLMIVLLKKQNPVALERLLDSVGDKGNNLDCALISTFIEIACNNCRLNSALLAFNYAKKWGLKIEKQRYLMLIGCLIRSEEFVKVVDVIEDMIKAGISPGSYLASLIIYRLGRARRPTAAAKIFRLLPDSLRNVASYTALVNVYFCAGSADKALEVLESMRRNGIHPASGTYDMLLAGLEKFGRHLDMNMTRKEKKGWLNDNRVEDAVACGDESICNLLFASDAIP